MQDFKKTILKQTNNFYNNGITYRKEVENISRLINLTNATEFLDFGTWSGLLAKLVLESNSSISNYTGIDAVPLYLEISKEFVSDIRYNTFPALLYSLHTAKFLNSFYTIKDDSLNTSSLWTWRLSDFLNYDRDNLLKLDTATPYTPEEFLNRFPQFLNPNAYVKIDIDGVDVRLTRAYLNKMITTGIHPKVIQFELWKIHFPDWPELKEKLIQCGYSLPNWEPTEERGLVTIALSKSGWWFCEEAKKDSNATNTIWKNSWSD